MLVDNRKDERGSVPIRTDRFFAVNASWYFATREGASIGPYNTKTEARTALSDFIEFIQNADDFIRNNFTRSLKSM